MDPALGAFFGGAPQPELVLWPCNLLAWRCWSALQTQWRAGMGGRTGLDYTAVLAWLRQVEHLRGAELREVLACIQAAEQAVLEVDAEHAPKPGEG